MDSFTKHGIPRRYESVCRFLGGICTAETRDYTRKKHRYTVYGLLTIIPGRYEMCADIFGGFALPKREVCEGRQSTSTSHWDSVTDARVRVILKC